MPKTSPKRLASIRQYRITHAEKVKAIQAAYYAAHAEFARQEAIAWYYKNREKVLAQKKAYRLKKLEEDPDFNRKKYAKYAEKNRARAKAYAKAHPEYRLSFEAKQRAAIRAPGAEKVSIAVLYIRDNKTCTLCHTHVKRSEWSIDHIIPLAKGGTHTYRNTALAHKLCNSRKRDKVVTQQLPMF